MWRTGGHAPRCQHVYRGQGSAEVPAAARTKSVRVLPLLDYLSFVAMSLPDFSNADNLAKFNDFLSSKSYVDGYVF